MKVLLYSSHAAAAEVVQRQGLFEATEVGFDAPAAVVKLGKHLSGKGFSIQQRGQQYLAFAVGQLDPDQSQLDLAGRINASLGAEQTCFRMVGHEKLCVFNLARV